jgi:Ca2+-binding EF-hand superfamily protein
MILVRRMSECAALAAFVILPLAAFGQTVPSTNVDQSVLDEFAPPGPGGRGGASQRRGVNPQGAPARTSAGGAGRGQNANVAGVPPVEQLNERAVGENDNRTAVSSAPNRLFLAIDANADGLISLAELRRAATTARSLDTDGDGNISLAEAGGGAANVAGVAEPVAGPATPADQALTQYDKNGDGKLTPGEMPPEMARMFSQMDANRDGELSRDELNAAAASMSMQWGGMMGPGQMMGPGGVMGGGMNQFMQYDRNRDNRLTSDEVPPQMAAMLRGADRNGDGAIDMQEIAGMAQQAQGMGPANRGFGPGGEIPPADGNRNGRGN